MIIFKYRWSKKFSEETKTVDHVRPYLNNALFIEKHNIIENVEGQ